MINFSTNIFLYTGLLGEVESILDKLPLSPGMPPKRYGPSMIDDSSLTSECQQFQMGAVRNLNKFKITNKCLLYVPCRNSQVSMSHVITNGTRYTDLQCLCSI